MSAPLVVVGSGLAGWTTVREFRRLDPQSPVRLVTADRGDFYAKPSLSNAFSQGRGPEQLVTTSATKMAESLNVMLHAGTRVEAIDAATQRLHTDQGELVYSQLVLATGAQAIQVPVAGNAAHRVRSVNSLADFAALHPLLTDAQGQPLRGRRVLVMGAGLIGCEFANDLVQAGLQLDLVDPGERALSALLPAEASAQLQAALQALGVRWHLDTTVQTLAQPVDQDTLLATLANGERLQADVILSAVGLRADTRLARAAGLACDRGIVVDHSLQTSQPGIYALGDAVQYASADQRALPFVMPIMHAAKTLAAVLTGQPAVLRFPPMPVAVKTPALPLVIAAPPPGSPGRWQADPESPQAWHWRDTTGRLLGFALAGAATARRTQLTQALAG